MPITVNGETYYRTAEVCRTVGISRSTFFRWLRQGSLADAKNVDRRGWRLFTKADIDRLKAEVNQIRPKDPENQDKVKTGLK
jgi:excisionase family DNA binding protein